MAQTLNPPSRATGPNTDGVDGDIPAFLKRLFPARRDPSGVFIAESQNLEGLKDDTGAYRLGEAARRPWIVVPFNAWSHQHVDPPWWCFYQTIRDGCFRAIRQEGVPVVEQTGPGAYRTRRNGSAWLRWLGLWRTELRWRLSSPTVLVFLFVMVAAIAAGLFFGIDTDWPEKFYGTVSWVVGGVAGLIATANTVLQGRIAPGRSVVRERTHLGETDPLKRFRKHFARIMERVERPVLVVVDDIDRCSPATIVELTRGLQTTLRSPRVMYLLLGDRRWIEQAFEAGNEAMNGIDVGPEHTFGGRFVEKAIQLSFILPGIGAHQEAYVREVLTGRSAAAGSPAPTRPGDRPSTGADTDTGDEAETEPEATITSPAGERGAQERIILRRAAQAEEIEAEIRHRLQPIARHLPGNPRHIKRIVNAIAVYQDSLLLTEGRAGDAMLGDVKIFQNSWSWLQREEVEISRKDGSTFSLRAKRPQSNSPFDVPGVNTAATTADIFEAVRESRER